MNILPIALLVLSGPPQLDTGVIEGDPHKLVEIRIDAEETEGVSIDYEWLVFDPDCDWRQYENGRVFVCTAPSGEYQARLRIQRTDWENKTQKKEWRVYTIKIRGPPDPEVPIVDVPDPTKPVNLSGPIYSITIRKAGELTVDQSTAILKIGEWVDKQPATKYQHRTFSPEAVQGDGSASSVVAGYVAKIPSGSSLPYTFVVQSGQGKSHVHWQGELLSAEQVIDTLQGVLQ